MKYEASTKLQEVIDMMGTQEVAIAVLADTHHSLQEKKIVKRILEEHGYGSYGTEGIQSGAQLTSGVLVVWKTGEVEVDHKECAVVKSGRIVKVKMKIARDEREVTVIGAYMPVRTAADTPEIDESWSALEGAVESTEGDVAIGGDLNAETPDWRAKSGRSARMTQADQKLKALLKNQELTAQTTVEGRHTEQAHRSTTG